MWLIGMMGSGKTTIGQLAAARLEVDFYDTDAIVEELAQSSISDLWERVGEDGFRELERKAVTSLPDSGYVAAAGGGAILDALNRDHMKRNGAIVWLRCDPAVLSSRLADGTGRPLLEGERSTRERLATVLSQRRDIYSGLATDIIDTDHREVADVVSEVVALWTR